MPLLSQAPHRIMYKLPEWTTLDVKLPVYGIRFKVGNFWMGTGYIYRNQAVISPILECYHMQLKTYIVFKYKDGGIEQFENTNMSLETVYEVTNELIKIKNGIFDDMDDNNLTLRNYYRLQSIFDKIILKPNEIGFDLNDYEFELHDVSQRRTDFFRENKGMTNENYFMRVDYKFMTANDTGAWTFKIRPDGSLELLEYAVRSYGRLIEMTNLLLEYTKNRFESFSMAVEI
jgi:hypothetical protein